MEEAEDPGIRVAVNAVCCLGLTVGTVEGKGVGGERDQHSLVSFFVSVCFFN